MGDGWPARSSDRPSPNLWAAWIEARWSQRTEREREGFRWMAQGLSNREIARQLGLTVRTVDFHVGNILQKLGAASRLEAVLWAKEHGFLPGQRE